MKVDLNKFRKQGFVVCLTLCVLAASSGLSTAQTRLFFEDFESLDLGPNVDEGLNDDDPREAVWSPDGPPGWSVDRSGVPGNGTPNNGVTEFEGWNFMDPIWWAERAGQERDFFSEGTEFVIAVADGDEWDDGAHPPGMMNTFLRTPSIPVADLNANDDLEFFTSWRPDGTQIATITASYDGGAPMEILRWESDIESDFYEFDLNPEDISVPLNKPDGAQEVVLEFGYTEAGNNWWWAVDNIAVGDYFEDFENVELGPNVEEGRAITVDNVWTKDPPEGWSVEDMVPGQDENNDFNGVTEWIGWSFTDKDWWVGVAGDQRRSEFTNGEGTVAVADPDEWDDEDHPDSASEEWYNTFMSTGEISLDGVEASTVKIEFDSSWRPEFDDNYQQTGHLRVSFDGGEEVDLLLWESDPNSDFYKDDDSTNERISVSVDNPEGATSMVVTFGMTDAGNDWWWAVDNIEVLGVGGGIGLPGDFNNNGMLDIDDIDDLSRQSAGGTNPGNYDLDGDSLVNDADLEFWISDLFSSWVGDANLDGEFNTGDLVQVLASGTYEADVDSAWSTGDFNGDGRTNTSDLVAALSGGGYEAGVKPAVAAVPEPSSIVLLSLGLLAFARRRRS